MGRWQTPDPMMQHQSPYLAMSDNPVSFMDPTGGWDWFSWGDGEGLSPEEYERRWQRAQDRANRSGDNDPYDDWMSGWGFGEDASGNMRGELMDFWQWQENLAYFKNNSWEKDVNGNWFKDYYIRYRFDTKDGNTKFGVNLEIVRLEGNAFQRARNASNSKSKDNNGSWDAFSRSGLTYNENIDFGLKVSNIAGNMVDASANLTLLDPAKYAQKGLNITNDATKFAKFGNIAGKTAIGLSYAASAYELATGHDNTSTWVDIGVTTAGIVAIGVVGATAAPFVAVGGLIYGIWSVAGGSDWINNNWGYRKP